MVNVEQATLMGISARSQEAVGRRLADAYPGFAAEVRRRLLVEGDTEEAAGECESAERVRALASQIEHAVIACWCSCSNSCPSFDVQTSALSESTSQKWTEDITSSYDDGWLAINQLGGVLTRFDIGGSIR